MKSCSEPRAVAVGRRVAAALLLILIVSATAAIAQQARLDWDSYKTTVRACERLDHLALIDTMEDEFGVYVALGDRFGLLRIIYRDGDGVRNIWTSRQLNGIVMQVLAVDLDGDGNDELLAWTDAAMLYIWSPQDQRLLYETLQGDFQEFHCMTIGNVDADEALEVVINADRRIHYLDGVNFIREWTSLEEYQALRMACADVDGDGAMELVLNTGQVLDARGGNVDWADQVFGARIELVDIDGDGLPEILTEGDGLPMKIFDADHRREKHLQ